MREDSPRWEQINASSHVHEQDGLRELASYLPDADPYHVWANVEFVGTDGSINEIDALVLTASGLYVLELKHWHGEIRGDGTQWVRRVGNHRLTPEDNPYILANRKAKRLASLIRYYARQQGREAEAPYVGAAVFLHARNMNAEGWTPSAGSTSTASKGTTADCPASNSSCSRRRATRRIGSTGPGVGRSSNWSGAPRSARRWRTGRSGSCCCIRSRSPRASVGRTFSAGM